MDERDLDESELEEEAEREEEAEGEEFGELIKYTLSGFVGGLVLAAVLDRFGFAGSGIGQWLVRTLAGEGESILEGLFALRKRLSRAAASMAEAYGWGKLLGMAFPWMIDGGSRLMGVEVNGLAGFYIPFFYALSDQIGGNVSGLMFLKRREGEWGGALRAYFTHPVMMTGLAVIALVPAGLFAGRWLGFIPATQVYTALETIAANLCWLPPLVGWLAQRRRDKGGG